MTLSEVQQTLFKWQEGKSTVLLRLDVKEIALIFFGTVNAIMDDRVMLEGEKGIHLRISLLGEKFKPEPRFSPESFTIRYSTGYCTFIGVSSGQSPEWQEIVSEFEQ